MIEPAHQQAIRVAYDTVAADYAELLRGELAAKPLDRALLAAFVAVLPSGPVADLGCGPGRITGHLAALGLDVFGVDLSPGMVQVARCTYPALRFDVGSMSALDLPAGGLAGAVAWYSIIHTPPAQLPVLFAEMHRVLAPAGQLLLAFQVGDDAVQLHKPYGHDVTLVARRLQPDLASGLLAVAGFQVHARLVLKPQPPEKVGQAYLLARKPAKPV